METTLYPVRLLLFGGAGGVSKIHWDLKILESVGVGSTGEFLFDSQEPITFVFASSPCVPKLSCFLTRGSLTQIRCNTCSNTICLHRTTAGHNELINSFYYHICQTIVYFGSNLLQRIVNKTKKHLSQAERCSASDVTIVL